MRCVLLLRTLFYTRLIRTDKSPTLPVVEQEPKLIAPTWIKNKYNIVFSIYERSNVKYDIIMRIQCFCWKAKRAVESNHFLRCCNSIWIHCNWVCARQCFEYVTTFHQHFHQQRKTLLVWDCCRKTINRGEGHTFNRCTVRNTQMLNQSSVKLRVQCTKSAYKKTRHFRGRAVPLYLMLTQELANVNA